jgi:DNA-binding beta-propeller fold protein YncE
MGTSTSTPLRFVKSLPTVDAAFGAGLLLSPDGARMYVANTAAGNVYVLNTADGSLVRTIALCSALGKMAFLGDNLLIADDEGKRLVEITTEGAHVRAIPAHHRVAAVATNGTLIVVGRCDWGAEEEEAAAAGAATGTATGGAAAAGKDTGTGTGTGTGGESPDAASSKTARRRKAVAVPESTPAAVGEKRIMLYSADAGAFIRAFGAWGAGPGQLRICVAAHFTSDGSHIVVAGAAVGEGLHVFTPEGSFVRRVLAGTASGGPLDFCVVQNYMVVADANGNAVHVYSKADFKLVQEVQLGGEVAFACPTAIATHDRRMYILNRHCNRIDVLEV